MHVTQYQRSPFLKERILRSLHRGDRQHLCVSVTFWLFVVHLLVFWVLAGGLWSCIIVCVRTVMMFFGKMRSVWGPWVGFFSCCRISSPYRHAIDSRHWPVSTWSFWTQLDTDFPTWNDRKLHPSRSEEGAEMRVAQESERSSYKPPLPSMV